MHNILSLIDKHKYISFDIFDTLITRKVLFPRDIFVYAEKKFNEVSDTQITGFRKWRILAEEKACDKAKAQGLEDCSFSGIYEEVRLLLELSESDCELLQGFELEAEVENCLPRKVGKQLLEYALSKNKRVFFTSDMYFGKKEIKILLEKSGIPLVDDNFFFVSSEIGKKKKTGKLFEYISQKMMISKGDILHIGDNGIGDYKKALEVGCKAYQLSQAKDSMAKTLMGEVIYSYFKNNRHPLSDEYLFLISNSYFDEPMQRTSFFQASPYRFGYMALSLLAVSFCIWLQEQVKQQKIKHLFFLSRDMKFIYQIYQLLYPNSKASYLLASRRSVRIPLLKDLSSILEPVYQPVYSNRIGSWLNFNFGLEETEAVLLVLKKHDIPDFDFMIGGKFSKDVLASIVRNLKEEILEAAENEKNHLVAYLKEKGLNEDGVAVVDIGYAASMQSSFNKLLKANIKGFYLATFHSALAKLNDPSLAKGYISNYGSPQSTGHGISTHRFIYESIFCDSADSFKCFKENNDGKVEPVFDIPKFDDSVRREKVLEIHEGVLAYVEDYINTFGNLENRNIPCLDFVSASNPITFYLKNPEMSDLEILRGIRFYDGETPNAVKYVLAPESEMKFNNSLWGEGHSLLKQSKKKVVPKLQNKVAVKIKDENIQEYSKLRRLENLLVSKYMTERKQRKYHSDRTGFFCDSKSKIIRFYFKKIGHKY